MHREEVNAFLASLESKGNIEYLVLRPPGDKKYVHDLDLIVKPSRLKEIDEFIREYFCDNSTYISVNKRYFNLVSYQIESSNLYFHIDFFLFVSWRGQRIFDYEYVERRCKISIEKWLFEYDLFLYIVLGNSTHRRLSLSEVKKVYMTLKSKTRVGKIEEYFTVEIDWKERLMGLFRVAMVKLYKFLSPSGIISEAKYLENKGDDFMTTFCLKERVIKGSSILSIWLMLVNEEFVVLSSPMTRLQKLFLSRFYYQGDLRKVLKNRRYGYSYIGC